jgi:23S rRNA A1618 N6-methylase RlmF
MMMKVTSPQSGGDIDVWINTEHVVKVWRRIDNITMLRFANRETMQIIGTPENFANNVNYQPPVPVPADYSYQIAQNLKDQTKQLQHLNILIKAIGAAAPGTWPVLPDPPYVDP